MPLEQNAGRPEDRSSDPAVESAGDPCSGLGDDESTKRYLACLFWYFDSKLREARGRITKGGRRFLEDLVETWIRYARDNHVGEDGWWSSVRGRVYWQHHARNLAAALNRKAKETDQPLDAAIIRDVLNELAGHTVAGLTRRLESLSAQQLEGAVLTRNPDYLVPKQQDRLDGDAIRAILADCPSLPPWIG